MATVKIAATGDILMWREQIESARVSKNNFNFDSMFKEIAHFFHEADLTIGNLETTFSGREFQYEQRDPVTNYPIFNCPDELADTLKKTGFDVLTTANNHCLDHGEIGLIRTLNILDSTGFHHTGTARSLEEFEKDLILEVNGIKIGILAYTYGTNCSLTNQNKPWMVNYITKNILDRIYRIKKKADLTIVCLHFGLEFFRYPRKRQKYWTQKCFEYGADIILGCHPHVIQPMEFVRVKDIDGIERNRFVIYSLGNFTSKKMFRNINTICSLILNLTIQKTSQGDTFISDVNYIPTFVHKNKLLDGGMYTVLPIKEFLKYKKSFLSAKEISILLKQWEKTLLHLGGKAR